MNVYVNYEKYKIAILSLNWRFISEVIDVNKTSESKEYDICYYWYFLNKVFKFQSYVCNRCHDL